MTRLDRYLLKLLLTLFGFFALVLIAVYWVNRAVSLFERLIADGQSALVVLEFTLLTLPLVIALVLPIAAFAASAYATNRLTSESELVAMQAAGLSPWRLARPVAVFGILVALMIAILANALVPMARARLAERQDALAENLSTQFLRPGQFVTPEEGVTLFIREISASGEILGLFLEDARDSERHSIYTAESAGLIRTQDGLRLAMNDGAIQTLRPARADAPQKGPWLSLTRFDRLAHDLGFGGGTESRAGRDLRDYPTRRLLAGDADMLARSGATADAARLVAHQRLAQPLMAPVAALLGFAALMMGGFSRFGVWRQITGATVALIAVQMLVNATEAQAARDPALWPVIYLPALIGAAIVALMLAWAGRSRRRPSPKGATP